MGKVLFDDLHRHVLYLAVLPAYRQACIDSLLRLMPAVKIYVSDAHLDQTVRTGIRREQYTRVGMLRFRRRAFLQFGHYGAALGADSLIVDLNPRSVVAWMFLVLRRILRRRTLVWGHLHPQAGSGHVTAKLRLSMRKLAAGTILYDYESRTAAQSSVPGRPTWVAPNSLYASTTLTGLKPTRSERSSLLYVGRFEPAKKVDLAVRAFAESGLVERGCTLTLIGDGSCADELKSLVQELGLQDHIDFPGWVSDPSDLAAFYNESFLALSPGFAGLGLTQSYGFGVPMAVAEGEPNSPEIELAREFGEYWFQANTSGSLAAQMKSAYLKRHELPNSTLRGVILERYTAEAMARGLANALQGKNADGI